MPSKKEPKVAYAVFAGRNPGVYSTWSEAEKEVKGFPRARYRGYSVRDGGHGRAEGDFREFSGREEVEKEEEEDTKGECRRMEGEIEEHSVQGGGRARAERDFQGCIRRTALGEEDVKGHAQRPEGEVTEHTIPEEPIRVYISGRLAQIQSPRHCVAQQLPTPPNTFVERKKERPISWEFSEDSRKKPRCVNGIEGATSPKLERTNEISPFDSTAGRADYNDQVLVATDTEDDSDAFIVLSNDSRDEFYIAGKVLYPELPVDIVPGRADVEGVVLDERSTTADHPTATSEHFSLALDYIALGTSFDDYGDFPDDSIGLDHISDAGPRMRPSLCDEQLALVELIMDGKNVFYTGSAGCGYVGGEGRFNCANVECLAQFEEIDKWAFRSAAWQNCNFEHVNLKVIHRQKDADLKALLEKCRIGLPYSGDEKWLLLHHKSDTRDAVKLFPKREDVRKVNEMKFAQLPGRALTYCCVDDFSWKLIHADLKDKGDYCQEPMNHVLKALGEHILESNLVLKERMLVILLVNWDLESSLANGSQGTVVGFEKHNPSLFPEVPRKWEYSGHKNSLLRTFVERTAVQEWPIVQFLNGRKRTIYPRCMINELGDDEPYSLLSRTQIPLTAAWAMTVHKAQGMTLSRVIVDLTHTFEPGQDYVALSRAETLSGLKVEGLPKQYTGPSPEVTEFLEEKKLMPELVWDESDDATSEQLEDLLNEGYDDF